MTHDDSRLERVLGRILFAGICGSSACLVVGLLLLASPLNNASNVFFTVGLLVLLATPVARVAASIGGYCLERDWLFVGLTTIVLVELGLSVIAALVFNRTL
jgi:uncharacterized membrane protein